MYKYKIKLKWLFVLFFLLESLILTQAFAGHKEECLEAGGEHQDSGSCTCKGVEFTPSEFICTKTGLTERKTSSALVPSDAKTWNPEIWKERNSRLFDAAAIEPFAVYSYLKVEYYRDSSSYGIQYDPDGGTIKLLSTFRRSSQIAPFQMQYTLLRVLAKKINKELIINNIERNKVINELTKAALKIDFPDESDTWTDKFQKMEFFKSPNGSNTLDLLKKMRPDKDPFSLISEVKISRADEFSPDVIIKLNAAIKIDPFIRIFEQDPEVANVPAFSKLGKMYKIEGLIWSIPFPPPKEISEMTQQEAKTYCEKLGKGIRLAKAPELYRLGEELGFKELASKYNPNLLDGIDNNFWSYPGMSAHHFIYEGAKGTIEKVDPKFFRAYPMCVLPIS